MAESLASGLPKRAQIHAVAAGFLGWTLDAFDFFVVIFMLDVLAERFHVPKAAIVATLTATLATRPLGAFIFGLLADRYGRRVPLMANVIFFSVVELLCGFSPNYTVFFILRALYGIGMGGEWGVGASLAMEMAPPRWRGVLSGILQSGYAIGNLLAAVAARFVLPNLGWRAMFWMGGLPALLALYIRSRVPESEAWKQHRAATVRDVLRSAAGARYQLLLAAFVPMTVWAIALVYPHLLPGVWMLTLLIIIFGLMIAASGHLAYLALLMTFMMFLSHGTQDLYPDFLVHDRHISAAMASWVAVIYTVGMLVGAIFFGELSERIGRRRSLLCALALSMAMIPFWAFGGTLGVLIVGSFLMQAGVQGAWGIMPAHLSELAPDAARGLLPGLVYQLGILFAAPTNTIEYALRDHLSYGWAIAAFEIATISLIAITISFSPEHRGRRFVDTEAMARVDKVYPV
jgi:SHS family lactate transporter-like MFS transporter